MFVDRSGRRLRRARIAGVVVLGGIVVYVVLVMAAFLSGPRIGVPVLPFAPPEARSQPQVPAVLAPPASQAPASPGPSPSRPPEQAVTSPAVPAAPSTAAPAASVAPAPVPAPTPSAAPTAPGKSSTAPGQSKKPPHP